MQPAYPADAPRNDRVLTVIGNRPQFIKAAAVSGPLRAVAREVLVHTGQHYDEAALAGLLRRAGAAAARAPARPRRRDEHGADRADARRARAAARARAAGARPRLRRHELDARRRARRRAGGDPGRARRGGHALVRPDDARGAQPRPDRPRERPAAVLRAGARGDPPRRARQRRGRGRRRRDGRRGGAARAAGGGAHRGAGAVRRRARRVRPRHRASRRQRRRPGPAGRARAPAAGGAGAGRAPAAPADGGTARRRGDRPRRR